jgi:ubiquinone/menaquinone biosynthesis C-methylase UbiE
MKDYDWNHLVKTYQKFVKPNFTVLEIGASTSSRTEELSLFCKEIIGIEYNKNRLLNNTKNIKYFLGDWQRLDKILKPNSIDLAISSHTIEHIPNDVKAINQLHKVLKSNRYAIITTPNRQRLTRSIIETFTGKRKFPYWEHIREYSESDLIKLIKKTKFKKFHITPVIIGLHFWKIRICNTKVPPIFKKYANCWEIILEK